LSTPTPKRPKLCLGEHRQTQLNHSVTVVAAANEYSFLLGYSSEYLNEY